MSRPEAVSRARNAPPGDTAIAVIVCTAGAASGTVARLGGGGNVCSVAELSSSCHTDPPAASRTSVVPDRVVCGSKIAILTRESRSEVIGGSASL